MTSNQLGGEAVKWEPGIEATTRDGFLGTVPQEEVAHHQSRRIQHSSRHTTQHPTPGTQTDRQVELTGGLPGSLSSSNQPSVKLLMSTGMVASRLYHSTTTPPLPHRHPQPSWTRPLLLFRGLTSSCLCSKWLGLPPR
ncbi:hypothetical protein E2C01_005109 [Portunus trituberculatus]|uniref:Uncharacterized protein n=1 Tax=Portunus trituberculatus TaxID=210409 RepID=A0A5B7CT46_PORTR|nr:hypothetical protein [Portunus trituberculatus]